MANPDKLKDAVAYVADRTQPGKVKLFKLLYFADFTAYAEQGKSISGTPYLHFPMGPVPKALLYDLDAYAEVTPRPSGMPLPEQRISGKADADASALSDTDQEILDRIIAQYGSMTGTRLKRITHREIPYAVTVPGEEIPYYLAPYRQVQKPTTDEVRRVSAHEGFMNALSTALSKR